MIYALVPQIFQWSNQTRYNLIYILVSSSRLESWYSAIGVMEAVLTEE